MPRWLSLVPIVTIVILAACGADIVSDPRGSDASAGPGGAGGGTGGQGAAGRGGDAGSSLTLTSASSTIGNPCEGAACGKECTVCNGVECFMGFCGPDRMCEMPATVCIAHDDMTPCPSARRVSTSSALCGACGGKGCTLWGCVLGIADGGVGFCCYDVVGGCVPNP